MQTISITEAARRTGYSRNVVKKWIDAGLLRCRIEPLSGYRRVCPEELRAFVASWRMSELHNPHESTELKTGD
jgi:predicted site-specific integrase-resolvase